jgi:hypothetical protein
MTTRPRLQRVVTIVAAVAITMVVSDALTFAATGSSLLLGKLNKAGTTTIVQNTGNGAALKLVTQATTSPPMIVNGKGKVVNLYSDRAATADNATKLGGKTLAQIQAAAKGAKGDTGAQGLPGNNGTNGTAGAKGDTGMTGPQYGREIIATVAADINGDVGQNTSIAIGVDGYPIISYYDTSSSRPKLARCTDPACTSAASVTIDNVATGKYNSVVISSTGLPIVSYQEAGGTDLRVVHCFDRRCTNDSAATGATAAGNRGNYSSMAVGTDGYPIISYYVADTGAIEVAHCNDAACSSLGSTFQVDTGVGGPSTAIATAIAIGYDNNPVIAYSNTRDQALGVAHCMDPLCASATVSVLDHLVNFTISPSDVSIAIGTDGFPIISYLYADVNDLRVAHCGDATCSPAKAGISEVDVIGSHASSTSIAIGVDGFAYISYWDSLNRNLMLAHCANVACMASIPKIIDSTGDVGQHSSLAIGADGDPVISYYDATTFDLKVAHVSRSSWTPKNYGR